MRYKTLGGTGLLVSEICLGTMTFGGGGFWTAIGTLDQSIADRVVGRALDAGVNFIDTPMSIRMDFRKRSPAAPSSIPAASVPTLSSPPRRSSAMGKGPNDRGASRGHLMDAAKASLKRLGTDYIDLYQIHSFDRVTPIEETVRALDDLVRLGNVRYVGLSNWPCLDDHEGPRSRRAARSRAATLQAYYTIAGRILSATCTG